MKQQVKSVLQRYPVLRRNRAYFELQRLRDRLQASPVPERSEHPEVVEALVRDGIVAIPDWASAEQVSTARDALAPWLEKLRSGEVEEAMAVDPEEHFYYRLPGVDERVPETRFFYQSPYIADIAHAYVAPGARPHRFEAEWRNERRARVSAEDLYHFDHWRPTFKAFLYLVDVGPDNAPFAYLAGSHGLASWRRKRAIEFDVEGYDGSFGHYFPGEVAALRRDHGFEERVMTGTAGTLILADFRGLHRGTPLMSGERIMLNVVYGMDRWRF